MFTAPCGSSSICTLRPPTLGRYGCPRLGIHGEQFFVETADLANFVNEVNFQDPVTLLTFFIQTAHRQLTVRMNVESHLVVRDLFVRELTDQMSRDGAAELPSELSRERLGVAKEFAARDVRLLMEISLAVSERLTDIHSQFAL